MSTLEDTISAWWTATPERRDAALRLLRGGPPNSEVYLTLRELSRQVGFSVNTLRRWEVPSHKIGGAKRYRRGETELYLKSEAFGRRVAALRAERKQEAQRGKLRVV